MYRIDPMPDAIGGPARAHLERCEPATVGHFRSQGFIDPRIACRHATRVIAGPAVTVSLPPGDGTLLNHAMRLLRPNDVLVIGQNGDLRHACWGGVLTDVAMRVGLAGVVIDGLATDIATVRARGLSLWSRGLAAMTTKLHDAGGEMNRPLAIGGIVVSAGDMVLADENGIVVVPPSEIDAVAAKALGLQQEEEAILARLAEGEILPDISGASKMVEDARMRR